jgi:hypothetical protein
MAEKIGLTHAMLAALHVRGLCVVPVEPTPEMIRAAWADSLAEDPAGVWKAMMAAIPEVPEIL